MNLKLFTKLQKGGTAFLLLAPGTPGKLQYFLMSFTVNYEIVTAGICKGSLSNNQMISFDVDISSLLPLLDKGRDFVLTFEKEVLKFEDPKGQYSITPLCVQHANDTSTRIAKKYKDFMTVLESYESSKEEVEKLELRLKAQSADYQRVKILNLSGGPSENPFTEDTSVERLDREIAAKMEEINKQLVEVRKKASTLSTVDFSLFKNLAIAAAKYGTTVSMCDTFAVVPLKASYLFQRVASPVLAIQGKLLQQLLIDKQGRFYSWNDDIVFCTIEGKGSERSSTVVFLQRYLPNVPVDDTLVTKGAVEEKYKLNLKGMLPTVSSLLGRFDKMYFEMSKEYLRMTNDSGEVFQHKFNEDYAATAEYVRALRTGLPAENIVMSTIEVPREIQLILSLFNDDFTVYVKHRKIIFQSGTLYAVFGR